VVYKVFYNQRWINDKWFVKGLVGLSIWPFMWFYNDKDHVPKSLLLHEEEHIRQQLRGLLIGYALRYWGEYIINRLKGMSNYQAYYNISYERKAREASSGLV